MKKKMTKDEYLTALKSCIQSLTIDEQREALQYYSDYFDEAGDDQKVIDELGSPEELAKGIVERFANALSETGRERSGENGSESTADFYSDALFYSFDGVKSVEMNLGAAQVVAIAGDKLTVETRGMLKENLYCRLTENGTLFVNNTRVMNLRFFTHERRRRFVPRILITIPQGASFERFKLALGAGSFEAKGTSFSYAEGYFDVGAGSLVAGNVGGRRTSLRCGMGSLRIEGSLNDVTNVDCGMGNVKVVLDACQDAYSCDAKVGLGFVQFGSDKKSGVCQFYPDEKKPNHFSINCGMGSVSVSFNK